VPGVTKLANVIIPYADQEVGRRFFTETLGLEQRADFPLGPDGRWIEVAPAGADVPIAICPPGPDITPGDRQTGISLQTDDADGLHAQLKQAGVDVDPEVSRFGDPVPPMFWFRDPEGNTLQVVEVR
jgi:catechol 2,3-dioxygenase-like lactoylglutathione lyase family enzyme